MTRSASDQGADFDRWLDGELRAALNPQLGPWPRPAEARYAAISRSTGRERATPIRFGIAATLGAKALVGGAVLALAAGVAGAATTQSANPATWGRYVSEAVVRCKAPDVNLGRCISAIAQEHGEQVRAQHSEAAEKQASPEPAGGARPGQREGQANDQVKGSGNASGQARGASQPSPAAGANDDHGHGKPSPHP
jgi:hypothetical protein